MTENQKKFLLNDDVIKRFVKKAKKKFKIVGITTSDENKVNFLAKQKIDLFKVTSVIISKINLLKKMNITKIKKIYLSTGFSNYYEINKILKKS